MQTRVIRLLEGWVRKDGEPLRALMIMPNSNPVKCSGCNRGVVVRWPWGATEPKISDCRVCKRKTIIRAEVELAERSADSAVFPR